MQLKLPTTYQEQIEILRSKGCIVEDPDFCESELKRINYYRLSAYFQPFIKNANAYISGTNFRRVCQIYDFDQKLRHILLLAIDEIEIFLRSQFAYYHAHKYGALGYMDNANYNTMHNHEKFLDLIKGEINANKNVLFVKHHIENYNGNFPVWVIVELFTFGMLSRFFADMPRADKKALSKTLFNENEQNIESWLYCCNSLRNICAHYGRLYFRIFSAVPRNFPSEYKQQERRLFASVYMLKNLYPSQEKWNNEIMAQLEALIDQYNEDIDLEHIGFPENWKTVLKK